MTADGTQTGKECLASQIDLYDVAGQIRAKFIALQNQVRLTQQTEVKK
jgi:hypothetical protein